MAVGLPSNTTSVRGLTDIIEIKRQFTIAQDQIDQLREALGADMPTDLETWGSSVPQEMRDQMAASALFAEKLNEYNALARLGFRVERGERAHEPLSDQTRATCRVIFGTPGVQAILSKNFEDENQNYQEIVKSLMEVAIHGEPAERIRAAEQLGRMCDWNAKNSHPNVPGNVDARSYNLFLTAGHGRDERDESAAALADPERIVDAMALLANEPGEAVLVPDEEPEHPDLRR